MGLLFLLIATFAPLGGWGRHLCTYLRMAGGDRPGTGILVLDLAGDRICAITRFERYVLPWFGLPASLSSR
jgi:hypothetical protein